MQFIVYVFCVLDIGRLSGSRSYSPLEDEDARSNIDSLCSAALLQCVGSVVSPETSSIRLSFRSSEKQERMTQRGERHWTGRGNCGKKKKKNEYGWTKWNVKTHSWSHRLVFPACLNSKHTTKTEKYQKQRFVTVNQDGDYTVHNTSRVRDYGSLSSHSTHTAKIWWSLLENQIIYKGWQLLTTNCCLAVVWGWAHSHKGMPSSTKRGGLTDLYKALHRLV